MANAWPAILLAGAVLGGIWGGVFTPIEAAGVGAFLAMIITLIRKKLTMNTLL
ncbi:MAG: TRAP transporter large permease subunit, partial [Clostridiaceae bacterium]|nr:TRAP transporter large permease subunit [Clostridiaceae bacterium]